MRIVRVEGEGSATLVTEEQIEKLRKMLFEDGIAVSDAARRLGVPAKRAYYQADKMGWTAKQRTTLPKNWAGGLDRPKVKKMLDEGRTYPEIAEKFGVSKQRIQQIADELGVHRKPGRRRAKA